MFSRYLDRILQYLYDHLCSNDTSFQEFTELVAAFLLGIIASTAVAMFYFGLDAPIPIHIPRP